MNMGLVWDILGLLVATLGPLAAVLVVILGHLAAISVPCKAILGPSWAFLGGLGGLLPGSWASLGDLGGPLRSLGDHVGHFVCYLGGFGVAFWGVMGASWAQK